MSKVSMKDLRGAFGGRAFRSSKICGKALWNSDALQISEAQWEEARRRLEEHCANPGSAISWEKLREELDERYG